MYAKLNTIAYEQLINKTRSSWMPKEPKKKKLNLKQIFIIKKRYKK